MERREVRICCGVGCFSGLGAYLAPFAGSLAGRYEFSSLMAQWSAVILTVAAPYLLLVVGLDRVTAVRRTLRGERVQERGWTPVLIGRTLLWMTRAIVMWLGLRLATIAILGYLAREVQT